MEEREEIEDSPSDNTKDAQSSNADMITALQASVLQTQSNFSNMYQILNSSLQQTMQMSQTMSQVMEQFLVNGLKIHVLSQSHNNGFKAQVSVSNEGVLPILGLTYRIELKSDLSPESSLPRPIFLTSSLGLKTSCENAPGEAQTSPCSIAPGAIHSEEWEFICSDFALHRLVVSTSFPSPGTGAILGKSQDFDIGISKQMDRAILETEAGHSEMAEFIDLDLNFIRDFFDLKPHHGMLAGRTCFQLSKKGILTVQLVLDPEASLTNQATQKMKASFFFDDTVEKAKATLLKKLILQELLSSSKAFSSKVR
ncbi:hypothetical protein DSO57_1008883 [Entomophthora muscae]|uniref:Uncharacterized protein n=2 Tax=Entomophthora muscae TaxID=34485 RepID=A0ACC2RY25_9FUNG|nr:hypothetical protein DSO57_1008883 [Entomophthora muscae]